MSKLSQSNSTLNCCHSHFQSLIRQKKDNPSQERSLVAYKSDVLKWMVYMYMMYIKIQDLGHVMHICNSTNLFKSTR